MARFDFSLLRANVELTPFISSTPYVEIDEDSLVITDRTLQGYGKIDIDSMLLDTQFTYYGRFKYGSETELLRSVVTGVKENLENQSSSRENRPLIAGQDWIDGRQAAWFR